MIHVYEITKTVVCETKRWTVGRIMGFMVMLSYMADCVR